MPCTLKQVPTKACGVKNSPGLKALYLIEKENVQDATEVNKAIATITKETGGVFFKVPFTRATGVFTDNYNGETEDSDSFNSTFKVLVPLGSPELSDALDSLVGVDLMAVGKTGSGNMPVQGTGDDYVRFTLAEGGSGEDAEGARDGYTLTFTKSRGNQGFTAYYTGEEADLLVPGV